MKSKYGHLSKSQLVKTFNGLTNSRERAMIKETAKRKGFYEESDFPKNGTTYSQLPKKELIRIFNDENTTSTARSRIVRTAKLKGFLNNKKHAERDFPVRRNEYAQFTRNQMIKLYRDANGYDRNNIIKVVRRNDWYDEKDFPSKKDYLRILISEYTGITLDWLKKRRITFKRRVA